MTTTEQLLNDLSKIKSDFDNFVSKYTSELEFSNDSVRFTQEIQEYFKELEHCFKYETNAKSRLKKVITSNI